MNYKKMVGSHPSLKILNSFIAVTLLVTLFISCRKGSGDENSSDYFTIEKSKIGIEVVDEELGIKFYPPVGWDLQQTAISKKIESRNPANPNEHFVYQPTYIFFDGSTGGLLSVGKVITNDTALAKSARLNYYKGLINSKHKNDNLDTGNFIHTKIYFSQFKIEKHNLVSFKLIFENKNGEIIEFDYTIPTSHLEGVQPSIKSSIGSINLL